MTDDGDSETQEDSQFPKKDNSFWEAYRKIENDTEAKLSLVEQDPEMAIRIFSIHADREVGALFVRRYRNSPEYNSAAYFISKEMNGSYPIRRLREPSDFWLYDLAIVENPVGTWPGQILRHSSYKPNMGVDTE